MKNHFKILPRQACETSDLQAMHIQRAKTFKNRLGWEVSIISEMEIDGYDALNPHYLIIRNSEGNITGSWRLLPTSGAYMLKDTFPGLSENTLPQSKQIWELSRFVMSTENVKPYRFASSVLDAMHELNIFALQNSIISYVTVTNIAIERLLQRTGIELKRLGPVTQIGLDKAIALEITIGAQTTEALSKKIIPTQIQSTINSDSYQQIKNHCVISH